MIKLLEAGSNKSSLKMDKFEKALLLQAILMDIRGSWGVNDKERCKEARKLAVSLKLEKTIALIDDYQYDDGRHFRCDFKDWGGYNGMEKLHYFGHNNFTDSGWTVQDKSEEFKEIACVLNYPESLFKDMKR